MVHRREINDVEVIFGNQGDLFQRAMTWFDHDTGSVWSQILGEAIAGPLAGERLELLPSQLTTWGAWKQDHPESLALVAETPRSGFDLDRMHIAVELGTAGVSYPIPAVAEVGVVNDLVGDIAVAVVVDPTEPSRWRVWARRASASDGSTADEVDLVFEFSDGLLTDVATGTTFDPVSGRGITGPLADQELAPLPSFTILPDDFEVFFPDGRSWPG